MLDSRRPRGLRAPLVAPHCRRWQTTHRRYVLRPAVLPISFRKDARRAGSRSSADSRIGPDALPLFGDHARNSFPLDSRSSQALAEAQDRDHGWRDPQKLKNIFNLRTAKIAALDE